MSHLALGRGRTSDDACTTDQESTHHVITKFSWRRAVAVPAVLTLALGGALLSSTAAQAAPADLVVSTPVAGSTADSREVTVSGTVRAGSRVDVYKGTAVAGTAEARITVGNQTTWSTVLTYSETDDVAQNITVSGLVGLSGIDPQTIAFNLPAVAPVQTFSVTAPVEGSQLGSRTVTFTGTGNDGSTVNVLDPANDNARLVGPAVVQNGAWSLDYTYDEFADRQQTVRVTQVTGGAGTGDENVTFNLPTGQTLVVNTPAEGSTTDSRTVVFSGTGNPGSSVNVLDAAGDRLAPQARVDDNGNWTATYVYAEDAAVAQTVRVTQVTGASGSGDITRSFNLPAVVVPPTTPVVLDAPVITSPTEGQVVVGDQVTFEGTGTPGSNILLAVVPTDQLPELEAPADEMRAAAEPADPADPIVVDADGNWTVTLALTPDDYTAAAVAFLLDADGLPVLDAAGQPIVSAPSADVAFSLVAAVVPAGTPATPIATGTTGLAYTGSEGTEAAIGIGAAVLLLGSTLMVLARRRAKLATTDVAGE